MKHLLLDFETLDNNQLSCAIIDCSVFVIDTDKMLSDKPYTTKSITQVKHFKLSAKDQVQNYKYTVSDETIKFWQTQSAEIRNRISPKEDDLTVQEFCTQFHNYLVSQPKIDYWWSRANTFDPIILWRTFTDVNLSHHLNEYLKFWRVRDVRTFIDAKFDFQTKNGFCPIQDEEFWNKVFQEHNSSWDVLADALRIQSIYRAEHDLEQIQR